MQASELYGGKVLLFDTSKSTAKDAYIAVYMFDNDTELNLADKIYELK